jgi:signal transduction histidine kinase
LSKADISNRIAFLQQVKIFQETDLPALSKVARLLSPMQFKDGATIISKGEKGESVYLIDIGQVVVMDENTVFSTLSHGDIFGEYSLIDTQTRSATVKSIGKTRLYRLKQSDFLPLIMNDLSVLRSFMGVFVQRLRKHDLMQKELDDTNVQVRKQKEELERLNHEKSQLMRIVAHDVRNPLGSAMNLTQLLRDDIRDLNDEQKECFGVIDNSLKRINDLVEKILDVHILEKRLSGMRIEKVCLTKVLKEVSHQFKLQVEQKALNIHEETDNVYAVGDLNYIKQVYENLYSNAVKYSPVGKNIYIRLYQKGEEVITEFRDEGQGLTKEDQLNLFKEFHPLSARPTAGESSYGLGLSIVKKYMDAMKGGICCESEAGKGASFIVSLPLANQ